MVTLEGVVVPDLRARLPDGRHDIITAEGRRGQDDPDLVAVFDRQHVGHLLGGQGTAAPADEHLPLCQRPPLRLQQLPLPSNWQVPYRQLLAIPLRIPTLILVSTRNRERSRCPLPTLLPPPMSDPRPRQPQVHKRQVYKQPLRRISLRTSPILLLRLL